MKSRAPAPRPAALFALALAGVLAAAGSSAQSSGRDPDFDAYVSIDPDSPGSGRVSGLVRNISDGPMRNIVLRVRHRWRWSGQRYEHTERTTISRVLVAGEPAGFAAVHFPPSHVPASASYDYDVAVVELSRIRLAPE